jgi:transmembrane sensor
MIVFTMREQDRIISRYLSGECTPDEEQTLFEWRSERPENDVYFQRFEAIWKKSAIRSENFNPDVAKALELIDSKINTGKTVAAGELQINRGVTYYAYRIAAVSIVGFCLAFAGYYIKELGVADDKAKMVLTRSSYSKQKVLLPDGTNVWLNNNSTLRYPEIFSAQTRGVFLEGEGYFEVVRNPEKPFIIHAGNSTTQVFGTAFNVRALSSEGEIIVTVTSGKVSFSGLDLASRIYLIKGEQGILTYEQQIVKKSTTDVNFLSWQTGKIIFKNTPFEEVAKVLSRHYHTSITIDGGLSQCRLTSTFENQSLQDVLDELAAIQEMTIKYNGKNIILHGKGC